jgi:O-antigen ligase
MVVGIGLYLFIQHSIQKKLVRRLGMAVLVAGLMAPLSRGPWVGSVVLLVVFITTGRYAIRRLLTLSLVAMLALPLVSILPGGERAINLLPFIGTTEKFNVDYREKLITNAMIVIARNPWFGSTNFVETPEMEEMRQGQGIIDIVNSYLAITLGTGWVGVSLFVSFFVLTLWGVFRSMRFIPDRDSEEYLLGRVLLAIQLSIMVIIFTVSSITVIPIVYWAIAGVGVGYAQMVRRKTV